MSTSVQFPEIREILSTTGLSINGAHKATGVARPTLTAMKNDHPVSFTSVSKFLNGLEAKLGFDVRDYRAILHRREAPIRKKAALVVGGPILAFENSENGTSGRRTAALIAADLRARMKSCSELAFELAEAAVAGDLDVMEDDPRQIQRYHNNLNTNIDEVFRQFSDLLGAQDTAESKSD